MKIHKFPGIFRFLDSWPGKQHFNEVDVQIHCLIKRKKKFGRNVDYQLHILYNNDNEYLQNLNNTNNPTDRQYHKLHFIGEKTN